MTHDVGGTQVNAPIERGQHAFMPWEVRVDALMWTLTDATRPGGLVMLVDELRRGIEALPRDAYLGLGYYEKWLLSMLAVLDERGLIDATEIRRRAVEIAHDLREHAHDERGDDADDLR
jgi:hypothetical protein